MKVEDYKMRILFEMDKKDYVPAEKAMPAGAEIC